MATPTPKQLDALRRLWRIANGNSGQCRTVAAFLLGLFNGTDYPFDLTSLRGLDTEIFQDCLQVLVMDYSPRAEVHVLLGVPSRGFHALAVAWRLTDEAAA